MQMHPYGLSLLLMRPQGDCGAVDPCWLYTNALRKDVFLHSHCLKQCNNVEPFQCPNHDKCSVNSSNLEDSKTESEDFQC